MNVEQRFGESEIVAKLLRQSRRIAAADRESAALPRPIWAERGDDDMSPRLDRPAHGVDVRRPGLGHRQKVEDSAVAPNIVRVRRQNRLSDTRFPPADFRSE
ncbi:MAG: hypothetical protein WCE35_20785 [Bradyrhizobium sp.]